MSPAKNGNASRQRNRTASDKMTTTTTTSIKMTTEQLIFNYGISADDLDEMMKTSITFTKPIEVFHRYECDFSSFSKLFKPHKGETKEETKARLLATWVSLIMDAGGGSQHACHRADVEIDYERDDDEQDEVDDDEPSMLGDIKQSAGQAYIDYQRTLPEEVLRRATIRAAMEKKNADERKAEQVANLKKMLADLGEKV